MSIPKELLLSILIVATASLNTTAQLPRHFITMRL